MNYAFLEPLDQFGTTHAWVEGIHYDRQSAINRIKSLTEIESIEMHLVFWLIELSGGLISLLGGNELSESFWVYR